MDKLWHTSYIATLQYSLVDENSVIDASINFMLEQDWERAILQYMWSITLFLYFIKIISALQ